MKRLLYFTALAIAACIIAAVLTDPLWLIMAFVAACLALLVDFLWHCAGNLARGRLEEEP